ncbi:uncharacterized protein B0H18DRAFT_1123454 [Fomitopsis serialis]|uniref:uncharacterized protein n=1 Tax=Fomitopsis serialis TaxID=139415 RepID=UPI002008EA4A|nr:uncharacterized protein B0H18DRAFT_1123454 [Neoantrodia serialis]KAH9917749.1 hypothetical protein B0H18DRAFT_1123454 [Neoantrodia serialis]
MSLDLSAAAQARRARRLARMRVYNLRFLSPWRAWGPFHVVDQIPARPTRPTGKGKAQPDSDDEEADWAPLPEPFLAGAHAAAPRACRGGALMPDWAFLAAVRIVVEANLCEAVGAAELAGLTTLDGLRTGSAPIDCSGGGEAGRAGSIPAPTGALAAFQGDWTQPPTTDGWDWAGVTGIWRRCICWLDYRDLISHNLSSDFNDPELTGSRAHRAHAPPRRVGTVSVVKDGSVHWRIVLLGENEGDPTEWATEGVQIGGHTAAMGVLGLWTGSQHERMDPLGPFWAWKVG